MNNCLYYFRDESKKHNEIDDRTFAEQFLKEVVGNSYKLYVSTHNTNKKSGVLIRISNNNNIIPVHGLQFMLLVLSDEELVVCTLKGVRLRLLPDHVLDTLLSDGSYFLSYKELGII